MSERQPDHSRRTINNPNSYYTPLPANANGQAKQLSNKVILIVGLASERSCHLAVVLAQMGADIAIIYSSSAYDAATRVSKEVEALGRRCLAIMSNPGGYLAHDVVQQVITVLGRLDVFISYPPQTKASKSLLINELVENDAVPQAQRRLYRSLLFPNFSFIKAALNALIVE